MLIRISGPGLLRKLQENIANRWKMIHEAKKQWEHGAVINLMWVWDMQDLSRDFELYNPGSYYKR